MVVVSSCPCQDPRVECVVMLTRVLFWRECVDVAVAFMPLVVAHLVLRHDGSGPWLHNAQELGPLA